MRFPQLPLRLSPATGRGRQWPCVLLTCLPGVWIGSRSSGAGKWPLRAISALHTHLEGGNSVGETFGKTRIIGKRRRPVLMRLILVIT